MSKCVTILVTWRLRHLAFIPIDSPNLQAIAGALRLEAAADADTFDGQATIRITAPGLDPLDISVTEHDKDGALEIELKDDQVAVQEGHTATFQVRLTAAPTGPVTVQTQHSDGDADLFVEAHSQVTFDETNWDRWQSVSLGANANSDSESTATFSGSATGLTAQTVNATAAYDTGQPVTYEILVDDYEPLPLQGEMHDFALYNRLRGDRGKVDPHGTVEFGRGEVEATVTDPAGGFAGTRHRAAVVGWIQSAD